MSKMFIIFILILYKLHSNLYNIYSGKWFLITQDCIGAPLMSIDSYTYLYFST